MVQSNCQLLGVALPDSHSHYSDFTNCLPSVVLDKFLSFGRLHFLI